MPDCYITDSGDLQVSSNGDIALTETKWKEIGQHAYMIIMTPVSDFALYPSFGTELESLIGMAQTEETGVFGCNIIKKALSSNVRFSGIPIDVKAIPTSYQSIRFDIYVTVGSRTELILSIEEDLGIR